MSENELLASEGSFEPSRQSGVQREQPVAMVSIPEDASVIRNCNFGFGIVGEMGDDGRINLSVPQEIVRPGYDGPAIREWAEKTAVAWLRQVAPHRLADEISDEEYVEHWRDPHGMEGDTPWRPGERVNGLCR